MQEQVRQERTDNAALWCTCLPLDDATIFHPDRHLQPTLDIEQHPWAIRMMADGLEQQLPVDVMPEACFQHDEIPFDVDVEHPVVSPATLTTLTHGINRRLTRPVAIRAGMKHRLQTRLQFATDNFLGDAIGNRRNT